MHKSTFVLVLLVFALLSVTGITLAQDSPDDHNPCLNGTWNCSDPGDPARQEWNWTCGWYLSYYSAGEISLSQVPEWCGLSGLAPGCYDSSDPAYYDQYYSGPMNTPDNAHTHPSSQDGTCSGTPGIPLMWVQTGLTDPSAVVAYCNSLGGAYSTAENLSSIGFAVPSDMWVCYGVT